MLISDLSGLGWGWGSAPEVCRFANSSLAGGSKGKPYQETGSQQGYAEESPIFFMPHTMTAIQDILREALREVFAGLGLEAGEIALEQPSRREHGDWSSNAAMALAKSAGKPPRDLAGEVCDVLSRDTPMHVSRVEVAGPGFVNFYLADSWWHAVLEQIMAEGADYGCLSFGEGHRVNLEFVSANPTGPLHAGHARGAAYGDALGSILERCGYEVEREFYVNDRGAQLDNFAVSLAARLVGLPPPPDGYHGDYVDEWAQELPSELAAMIEDIEPRPAPPALLNSASDTASTDPEPSNLSTSVANPDELSSWYSQVASHSNFSDLRTWCRNYAIANQQATLGRLNISFERWFSETSLLDAKKVDDLLIGLQADGTVYQQDGATWLRVSDFGDDQDRVLVKSDGELTYLLPDIAYHQDKLGRADTLIDIWGADHHGYIARMKAAIAALGEAPERLEVILCQIVKLLRDSEEVKISKREGDLITLDEIINEIGSDAARFAYLLQSPDSQQTVDLNVLSEKSMENPVFYVQYAHVRACAILRQARELGVEMQTECDLTLLSHDRERDVLRYLGDLPAELKTACHARAPHRIVSWLRELSSAFHSFYHDCRVTGDDVADDLTQARLALVDAVRIGLAIGLDLVGVSKPEQM